MGSGLGLRELPLLTPNILREPTPSSIGLVSRFELSLDSPGQGWRVCRQTLQSSRGYSGSPGHKLKIHPWV